MDPRLYVATCSGDVRALSELLKVEPFILHTVQLATSDTPLHIAVLLGHSMFAKVTLGYNPELAKEFNHQGLSPVHLASLKGYLAIVIDLLDVDKSLCLLKDRDGRTPLHCAVIKGRLDVIQELLSRCPESAKELTSRSETVLHLAVKNNQCETLVSLLDILRGLNLADELVDCKDEDGNTILHLATARKQHQIVKILSRDTKVSVNAVNASECTALDIAVMCCLESDDMVIVEMLCCAGGQRASECRIPTRTEHLSVVVSHDSPPSQTGGNENLSRSARSPNSASNNKSRKEWGSMKSGIIVLCSLFATFSFQAALNPPGGFWPDWQSSNVTNTIQTAKANKYTNSPVPKLQSKLERLLLTGPIPQLNVTAADLYGPAKATNIALAAFDFILFLKFDAVCFIMSLAPLLTVMLTTDPGETILIAITIMTLFVVMSAAFLYHRMLVLITNAQFAEWAIKNGVEYLYVLIAVCLFTIIGMEMKRSQKK